MFAPVIKALILIWFNLVIAKALERIDFIRVIGRNTLFICGNEYLLKSFVEAIMINTGINFVLPNPATCYIYTAVLIFINIKLVIPVEKKIIESIKSIFRKQTEIEASPL